MAVRSDIVQRLAKERPNCFREGRSKTRRRTFPQAPFKGRMKARAPGDRLHRFCFSAQKSTVKRLPFSERRIASDLELCDAGQLVFKQQGADLDRAKRRFLLSFPHKPFENACETSTVNSDCPFHRCAFAQTGKLMNHWPLGSPIAESCANLEKSTAKRCIILLFGNHG